MATTLQNFYKATVSRSWTASTGDFNVSVAPTVFPGWIVLSPNNATLREIVYYTETGTNAFGPFVRVTQRGVGGTTAQAHSVGETVRMNVTAEHWKEMQDEIDAIIASGAPNASQSQKGLVEAATDAQVTAGTNTGETGALLFATPGQINTQIDTKIAANTITPETFSINVTSAGATANVRMIYGDTIFLPNYGASTTFFVQTNNYRAQSRQTTSDWADADTLQSGIVCLGDYIYLMLVDNGTTPDTYRIYRYDKNNIAAGGTLMGFAGATVLVQSDNFPHMTCDGTFFYFMHNAGNSANSYVLAKYSVSGTTFTYVSSITCGSTAINSFVVKADGTIYAVQGSGVIAKYNTGGTQLYATATNAYVTTNQLANIQNNIYIMANTGSGLYQKIILD